MMKNDDPAAAPDNVFSEMMKSGGPILEQVFLKLITTIIQTNIVPVDLDQNYYIVQKKRCNQLLKLSTNKSA